MRNKEKLFKYLDKFFEITKKEGDFVITNKETGYEVYPDMIDDFLFDKTGNPTDRYVSDIVDEWVADREDLMGNGKNLSKSAS